MSAHPPPTDYFSINSTKIYSANPSGNYTVTSLPLTRRHLQDLESPSCYNLLFDLIANRFSSTPLHRRTSQLIPASLETSSKLSGTQRPTLSATKSAEAVLTPQRRSHQQGRGCTKFTSSCTPPARPPAIHHQVQSPIPRGNTSPPCAANSAESYFASPSRGRPHNSPYESPSRIAARSVAALLTLPEHTPHDHDHDHDHDHNHEHDHQAPHRPSPVSARSAEVILPRHNTILNSFHRHHPNATQSADPIISPESHDRCREQPIHFRPPQRVSSLHLVSTTSLPSPVMAPEHPHHLNPDSPDPFTAFGNPHQKTTLSPHKAAIFSLRNVKKAARIRAAERKAEHKQKERADKASKKIEKENTEAAKRAERGQAEAAEKMKKLEREAEKQRLRREEQAANMEKKRRREEEKERVMEVRRHKRVLGGMSWGFDPGAGTRASRESGSGSGEASNADESGASQGAEECGLHRVRRGTTWGITGGGPGRVGGYHGSDVSTR